MARTIAEVKEELKTIQNDLANFENSGRNIDPVRLSVRERIFRGDTIRSTDNLGLLLKKEYELEKEQNELLFTEELIQQGRDPKSERFQHDLNLKLLKKDLEIFNPQQIDNFPAGAALPAQCACGNLLPWQRSDTSRRTASCEN